uniref:CHRD domain-containing protein n=1 Tax=Pseudictyota dubia TaxID=2749911 RepID=A0A7R9ZAM1_9STRA|mmetsp:Transcript_35159/g.64681  ORF Transcript_35159/g.64681 Transcript_35159/m.64681 type:complete len:241 (+) Transcript_35159:35-757(+)|eukprot:CAMPEP_0197442440 /NCGR_PEP_ID=MMETSP1175-20131217/8458_1 /TAXON_ID=1003142 /ORGANISM="Triceratium dubium, Strain CCMP147" /LENGTH=240 /DNA_ID=CAMNT_0042972917 /DNA_START=22 /DNA_END=744 /DNA_ORIENTATION=-
MSSATATQRTKMFTIKSVHAAALWWSVALLWAPQEAHGGSINDDHPNFPYHPTPAYKPATTYKAHPLTGFEVVPPVQTTITGTAKFKFDDSFSTMRFDFGVDLELTRPSDSDDSEVQTSEVQTVFLPSGTDLRCGKKGTIGPVVIPLTGNLTKALLYEGKLGVGGTVTSEDMVTTTRCGENLMELARSMTKGHVYVNVESLENPEGQVRGQVSPHGTEQTNTKKKNNKKKNNKKKKKKKH